MKNPGYAEHRTGYIFLFVFVLLSVGIATSGYYAYRNYEKNYRAEVESRLSVVADLKVHQIVKWRKERFGDGQIFYKNPIFSASVKRYIQNKKDRNAKTEILAWVGQIQSAFSYDLMMLLDSQLNTVLVYPENKERAHLVVDQKNTEMLHSGKIVFQDFYRNDQDQHIYLKILAPILEEFSPKQLIGVLALRISPEEYLYPLINTWPTPSRTSETLIIRKDGSEALFLNELRFKKNTALNFRIPLSSTEYPSVKAALGQTGIVEGVDYRGVPVIADVRAIPDSPWFLVARIDMEEVYAPLKERMWLTIIFVGVLFIGAGTSIGLVWRHQRSRFYQQQFKSTEALRVSEIKYRQTFDVSPIGIVLVGFDNRFLHCNNAFSRFLGYSLEELIKKTIKDVTLPEDRNIGMADMMALMKGEVDSSNVRKRYMRKDGQVIWGEVTISIVRDSEEHPQYFFAIIQDITERKHVEEELKRSKRLLEETGAVGKVGGWTFNIDTHKQTWTEETYRLHELDLSFQPTIENGINFYTPASKPIIGQAVQRAIEVGEPWNLDLEIITAKGNIRKVNVIGKADLKNRKIYGFFQDITERKEAEVLLNDLIEKNPLSIQVMD
jgi:PAS domain S-box-containing protein